MRTEATVRLVASPDGLLLTTPYDAMFLVDFKNVVSASARRWDGARKVWVVAPREGEKVAQLVQAHYGVAVEVPKLSLVTTPITEVVQLAYLGGCRERASGAVSASGYTLGNRNPRSPDLIFPEACLRTWFKVEEGGAEKSTTPPTLYTVLCVERTADASSIKAAYRRMARQTHPDVNKEPDAGEAFRRVQAAWDVLGDVLRRRKYDAGLVLEERAKAGGKQGIVATYAPPRADTFRAPLRCGLLLVQGERRLGQIHVSAILSWEDLTREGKILVSSWPTDAEKWREEWVQP